ncbi:MAG: TerB N-terminal domain-containing protein, partial [Myxococcales bacterium]|nr:TerB N-terminal domain-containing protein [Myxococcales bacterium]
MRPYQSSDATPEPALGFVRERADQVRWFGPGEAVQIGGWCIPGGMIYVGTRFQPAASAYGCQQEPSMIDPTLAVAPPGSRSKAQLPYWPQYAQISPESRAALLEWQAGGRVDPGVQLGIVFLFLYGLERRLLIDGILEGDPHVRDEAPALVAELERLAEIYGSSHSFQRYSAQLILFARLALMD